MRDEKLKESMDQIQFIGKDPKEFLKELSQMIDKRFGEHIKKFKRESENEILTVEEAAHCLKVAKSTLYRWRKAGILKSHYVGNKVRYKRSELLKCQELERSETKSQAQRIRNREKH